MTTTQITPVTVKKAAEYNSATNKKPKLQFKYVLQSSGKLKAIPVKQ